VNAEFNVWLLIVGLVVGAGLVWVVMLDGRRREAEIDAAELPREAAWLSAVLAEDGYHVSPRPRARYCPSPPGRAAARSSNIGASRPIRRRRRDASRARQGQPSQDPRSQNPAEAPIGPRDDQT
jgi:hypothetical protein